MLLNERIFQDPLDNFLDARDSKEDIMNTQNNVKEFMQNTQALRVVDSFCRDFVKGNCRGSKRLHDNQGWDQVLWYLYLSTLKYIC